MGAGEKLRGGDTPVGAAHIRCEHNARQETEKTAQGRREPPVRPSFPPSLSPSLPFSLPLSVLLLLLSPPPAPGQDLLAALPHAGRSRRRAGRRQEPYFLPVFLSLSPLCFARQPGRAGSARRGRVLAENRGRCEPRRGTGTGPEPQLQRWGSEPRAPRAEERGAPGPPELLLSSLCPRPARRFGLRGAPLGKGLTCWAVPRALGYLCPGGVLGTLLSMKEQCNSRPFSPKQSL